MARRRWNGCCLPGSVYAREQEHGIGMRCGTLGGWEMDLGDFTAFSFWPMILPWNFCGCGFGAGRQIHGLVKDFCSMKIRGRGVYGNMAYEGTSGVGAGGFD